MPSFRERPILAAGGLLVGVALALSAATSSWSRMPDDVTPLPVEDFPAESDSVPWSTDPGADPASGDDAVPPRALPSRTPSASAPDTTAAASDTTSSAPDTTAAAPAEPVLELEVEASWISDALAGRRTASGAHYDPEAMTAAHRAFPFGTRLRVTHLGNGRSVEVVVVDRGPFVTGRDLDVSRAAAEAIGMLRAGHARVRLEVLDYGE